MNKRNGKKLVAAYIPAELKAQLMELLAPGQTLSGLLREALRAGLPAGEQPMKLQLIRKRLGVSPGYFAAMKSAMGIKGAQMGMMSQFTEFFRTHPKFKQSDVYHPSACRCQACRDKHQLSASAQTERSSALSRT